MTIYVADPRHREARKKILIKLFFSKKSRETFKRIQNTNTNTNTRIAIYTFALVERQKHPTKER